jgi:hypothetical protein
MYVTTAGTPQVVGEYPTDNVFTTSGASTAAGGRSSNPNISTIIGTRNKEAENA